MNFDEEEDEEDEDSSSSSQLNSNTRPGSATSKKSNKVRSQYQSRSTLVSVYYITSENSQDRPGFPVLFSVYTKASLK